ncbi:UNVERIFIED_CONTAM: Retrovirus-related Pol polyprotein from transposon RE2 [Sesamum latifolium]|uniref:Retrovirus-related Pol polyprotein from transposon RE2 n=1 Tax=Sesamum latifolium TaxID=2727402 RepID=A0AAW2VBQ9_9LAMI
MNVENEANTSETSSISEVVRMELMRLMRGGPPMEQQKEINLENYTGAKILSSSSGSCRIERDARLVAKGYNQIEGVDYFESFLPVAKVVTIRIFFSIVAARSWPIQQVDINNAFLLGYLDEEVLCIP